MPNKEEVGFDSISSNRAEAVCETINGHYEKYMKKIFGESENNNFCKYPWLLGACLRQMQATAEEDSQGVTGIGDVEEMTRHEYIRYLALRLGMKNCELSREYGRSIGHISNIINRKYKSHRRGKK